jgi:phosphoglycolate phosphatase
MILIFDLDGTLVDSAQGVIDAVKKTLEINQIKPIVNLRKELIGPPLEILLSEIAGISDKQILDKLKTSFTNLYDNVYVNKIKAYDGIQLILEELKLKNHKLYVATNKRTIPTLKIINKLSWDNMFDDLYSLDKFTPSKINKAELLKELIKANNLNISDVIYIGDKFDDQIAAQQNNIKFLAAAWGYDSWNRDEKVVLQNPSQIHEFI